MPAQRLESGKIEETKNKLWKQTVNKSNQNEIELTIDDGTVKLYSKAK